eukprot:7555032-Ditylum_brightwellii.AAC.1
MSELSRNAKGKTGMKAMKRNARRLPSKEKILKAELYMKSVKEITQFVGRTCKQLEDIMGAIKNLTELVLVAPNTTTVNAMSNPDDPMDQAIDSLLVA